MLCGQKYVTSSSSRTSTRYSLVTGQRIPNHLVQKHLLVFVLIFQMKVYNVFAIITYQIWRYIVVLLCAYWDTSSTIAPACLHITSIDCVSSFVNKGQIRHRHGTIRLHLIVLWSSTSLLYTRHGTLWAIHVLFYALTRSMLLHELLCLLHSTTIDCIWWGKAGKKCSSMARGWWICLGDWIVVNEV